MANIDAYEIKFYERERDIFLERARELSEDSDELLNQISHIQQKISDNLDNAKRSIDRIKLLQEL